VLDVDGEPDGWPYSPWSSEPIDGEPLGCIEGDSEWSYPASSSASSLYGDAETESLGLAEDESLGLAEDESLGLAEDESLGDALMLSPASVLDSSLACELSLADGVGSSEDGVWLGAGEVSLTGTATPRLGSVAAAAAVPPASTTAAASVAAILTFFMTVLPSSPRRMSRRYGMPVVQSAHDRRGFVQDHDPRRPIA
jgi:hypothetical protein